MIRAAKTRTEKVLGVTRFGEDRTARTRANIWTLEIRHPALPNSEHCVGARNSPSPALA
jgi:hypothetical protein